MFQEFLYCACSSFLIIVFIYEGRYIWLRVVHINNLLCHWLNFLLCHGVVLLNPKLIMRQSSSGLLYDGPGSTLQQKQGSSISPDLVHLSFSQKQSFFKELKKIQTKLLIINTFS